MRFAGLELHLHPGGVGLIGHARGFIAHISVLRACMYSDKKPVK